MSNYLQRTSRRNVVKSVCAEHPRPSLGRTPRDEVLRKEVSGLMGLWAFGAEEFRVEGFRV